MKKILIGILIFIVIGIAVGTFLLGKLDGFIATTIETEGSKALGVSVTVDGVTTDLKQGSAVIKRLTIANPAGYSTPHAFQVQQFSTVVDYAKKEIAEINIIQPIISAEVKGGKNNFKDLVDQMPASSEEADKKQESEDDNVIITIQAINVKQATVNLVSDITEPQQFVMSDLAMRNLSGTPEQIAKDIAQKLTNHISAQVAERVKEQVKEKVKGELKEKLNEALEKEGLGGKLKKLFN